MSTSGLRVPLTVGAVALVLGWAWVAVGGVPFQGDEVYPCGRTVYETESWSFGIAAWPPGATTCEIARRDGTVERAMVVPWREWLSIALFALCASGFALAFVRRALAPVGAAAVAWLAGAAVAFGVV